MQTILMKQLIKLGMKLGINMNLKTRINILISLGKELSEVCENPTSHNFPGYEKIRAGNTWFTEEFVKVSLSSWENALTYNNIEDWLKNYKIGNHAIDKKLGLILAGNIPMVGFHDIICSFLCGINLRIKMSSKDNVLMKWIIERINFHIGEHSSKIEICEERLSDFDAIIATGSNNSNRYFEYYFSDYPNILRKNRNSVAVLSGKESKEELEMLADDIFLYFGLGCRSISKIYIPKSYDFNLMGNAFQKYAHLRDHFGFFNNLTYQYAIMSMNSQIHVNFENLFLVENQSFFAPIGILNFEYYTDINVVEQSLQQNIDILQCIVSNHFKLKNVIPFGKSQFPELSDYADNKDTISFILNLQL